MEKLVKQLIEQQCQYNSLLQEQYLRAARLLEKSEDRIDRTNAMIQSLANSAVNLEHTLANITKEYCVRIEMLAANRDQVLLQNKVLLDEHALDREEIRQLREEQRSLSAQLMSLVAELSRSQSGVKIENKMHHDKD